MDCRTQISLYFSFTERQWQTVIFAGRMDELWDAFVQRRTHYIMKEFGFCPIQTEIGRIICT